MLKITDKDGRRKFELRDEDDEPRSIEMVDDLDEEDDEEEEVEDAR